MKLYLRPDQTRAYAMLYKSQARQCNLTFKAYIQEKADKFGHMGRHYIGEKEAGSLFDQGRPYYLANLYGSGS